MIEEADIDVGQEAQKESVSRGTELDLSRYHQFGDQLREILDTGESLNEIVETSIDQLKARFSDVLEPEVLDRRLADLRNARLVSAEEFERLSFGQEHGDGAACLIYQMEGGQVRTIPVFAPHAQAIDLINSVLHEGTHLAALPPNKQHDYVFDEVKFVKYLGPIRTVHKEDGRVDPFDTSHSLPDMKARILFWEAVTDWIAMEESLEHCKTDQDETSVNTSGYLEKIYLLWLFDQAKDSKELEKKMKLAYVDGDEHEFIWELGRQFSANPDGMEGWNIYREFMEVLKTPLTTDTWDARFEAWQNVILKRSP